MRNVFLDCGAHEATSLRAFFNHYPQPDTWHIWSFEPNTALNPFFELYRQYKLFQLENKAVWIYDGEIDFYLAGVSPSGSTLFPDKTTWKVSKRPIRVPCIDFSAWVKRVFLPDDYIILKMNMEGAEYAVLDKMLQEGTIDLISDLYVSFHHDKIPSIGTKTHRRINQALLDRGFTIKDWKQIRKELDA
jgi:FkbM family methyltransferase